MIDVGQSLIMIAVIAAMTFLTRVIPFLLFPDHKETPPYIDYLGQVLPYAAIGLLVVYCLKGVSLSAAPYGLPEAIAIAVVVVLHIWRKNTLISIGIGTLTYMVLVQAIFV